MNIKSLLCNPFALGALLSSIILLGSSCSDDNGVIPTYQVSVNQTLPSNLPSNWSIKEGTLTFTELNTGHRTVYTLPLNNNISVNGGIYSIQGELVISYNSQDGSIIEKNLRAVASQIVINNSTQECNINWFYYRPENTLVFGEIYFTGSLNAKGTGGLYDTYFTIYNNTDVVQYADGLAIVESKFLNTSTDKILTDANLPANNFTAQTIYVIPGNGQSVAIKPGESIKIVDQAIDWSEQVAGALNHTDADFEWYDESSSASVVDTDNPSVANLDKWYSYSPTIWIPSQQCNRSYALVRFPEGMNPEQFLSEYDGTYKYINTATGKEMNSTKCYLIKYEWIIDGVNLCPTEKWTTGALSTTADISYAAISDKNADKNRFGKKLVRRVSGTSAAGNTVLMDTNDSASDFEVVPVR